ncbi:MAG: VOC family protein [Planctomycetota bacterium]
MPDLDKIHHVAVQVDDIKEAVEWYRERFRCEIGYQDATWALLQFENTALALIIPEQHPPHFAVERDDAGKFGELTGHRDGTKSTYLEDPFGNFVEALELPASMKRSGSDGE